jgi:hypothetical protein
MRNVIAIKLLSRDAFASQLLNRARGYLQADDIDVLPVSKREHAFNNRAVAATHIQDGTYLLISAQVDDVFCFVEGA